MLKIDTPLNPAATGADADAIRLQARAAEAAEKFEAFFIKQMMSQMRSATRALADDDSPLKNKVNEDMMDMADGLVADAMAGQRAFGIADLMLKQILPAAGLSPAAAASPSPGDESKQGMKP
ncbi:rod-binding protein [Paucibacter sp. M5-1]|uniref:rod-binding protein n=1 Tax=Paucibacter sp. M5-1 TaxID=3015998 RepID=UPI0022B8BFE4|nr:rod-binding protein [Paucibacter sp. M5-1]MCZ7884679.1 rod-binding protein [Paucibacter sp. M5-1]